MASRKSRHRCIEEDVTNIKAQIPQIFQDAQNTRSNWTNQCVKLYQIHEKLVQLRLGITDDGYRLIGENAFRDTVKDMLIRVMSADRGVAAADAAVSFFGKYVKYLNETPFAQDSGTACEIAVDGSTSSSRFVDKILAWLISLFGAKDKLRRTRALAIVGEILPYLGEIAPERYKKLMSGFLDRINDKEIQVRREAASCLATLLKTDSDEDVVGDDGILALINNMVHDPNSDIRKKIIEEIPITGATLSEIIASSRDEDSRVRKSVYDRLRKDIILKEAGKDEPTKGSTHPKMLSISQRELIVENGLRDREPSVKTAAATLVFCWYRAMECKNEDPDVDPAVKAEDHEAHIHSLRTIDSAVAFLDLFDIGTRPESAQLALVNIFETQHRMLDDICISEPFWTDLTPEKAFFAQCLVQYFTGKQDTAQEIARSQNRTVDERKKASHELTIYQDKIERILPHVTKIVLLIEEAYNQLLQLSDKTEDQFFGTHIVLTQLLKIAVHLDYCDELGRRKMLTLIRDMLKDGRLPSTLITPVVEVLRLLNSSEREFVRLVVEAIQDLRECLDTDLEEPTTAVEDGLIDATNTQVTRDAVSNEKRDEIDGRCLSICVSMLEYVMSSLENNSTLDYAKKLIVVRATKPGPHQYIAIKALGLCSLISEKLALESLTFWMWRARQEAPPALKMILYQALFDIYLCHQNTLFKVEEQYKTVEKTVDVLLRQIQDEEDPDVQALICIGIAKMVITNMISNEEIIMTLVKAYLSPATLGNLKLKQGLFQFFNMYSGASSRHQEMLCNIFILVYLDFCEDMKEFDEDEVDTEVPTSFQVADVFIGWTDPSRIIEIQKNHNKSLFNPSIQLELAENIIKFLFEKNLKVEIEREDRRVLCRMLGRLYIPDKVDDCKIRSLSILTEKLFTLRPLKDSVCKNAVTKFHADVEKRFHKQLEGITENDLRELEELRDLFLFIDDIIPMGEDDDILSFKPSRGIKRRSDSIITSTTASGPSSPRPNGHEHRDRANKRPRLSATNEDDESDEENHENDSLPIRSPKPPVRRPQPRRATSSVPAQEDIDYIVISSDSDDCIEIPPPKNPKAQAFFRRSVKQEASGPDDLEQMLARTSLQPSENTFDSIMDSDDSEEEEEEVTDLLADD